MTAERLEAVLAGMTDSRGALILPQFRITTGPTLLVAALKALGIPLLDPADPVLTNLAQNEELCVSGAVQQTAICVDEQGTTVPQGPSSQ